MRTYDWLVFAFLLTLGFVVPHPMTQRQTLGCVVLVVLLVLMACLLVMSLR
jgi:hypothetical protein